MEELIQRIREEAAVTLGFYAHGEPFGFPEEHFSGLHLGCGPRLKPLLPLHKRLQDKELRDTLITPKVGNPRYMFPGRYFVVHYNLDLRRVAKRHGEETQKAAQWLAENFNNPGCIYTCVNNYCLIGERELTDAVFKELKKDGEKIFELTKGINIPEFDDHLTRLRKDCTEVALYDLTSRIKVSKTIIHMHSDI
jgi:hypothetical protein